MFHLIVELLRKNQCKEEGRAEEEEREEDQRSCCIRQDRL
jgi:hypothetical protein